MCHVTEKEWQSRVTDFASLRGWRWWHAYDARRSNPGFPDLVLVRDRVIFAELKTQRGRIGTAQASWLLGLRAAGATAVVWRPSDWPEVQEVLK